MIIRRRRRRIVTSSEGSPPPAALEAVNRQSGTVGANQTVYTVADVPIGSPAANRLVEVMVYGRSVTDASTIESVFIGGVEATLQVNQTRQEAGSVWDGIGIYGAIVPTGTTAAIEVTFSSQQLRLGWASAVIYGGSAAPHDTGFDITSSTTPGSTVNCPEGGVLLAACSTASSAGSATWSGATEDFDLDIEGGEDSSWSGAYEDGVSEETARAVGVTWTSALNTMFAVATIEAA